MTDGAKLLKKYINNLWQPDKHQQPLFSEVLQRFPLLA